MPWATKIHCTQCGSLATNEAKYCAKCGNPVSEALPEKTTEAPNDSDFLVLLGRVVYLIIGLLVVLLVVLGIAGILWFGIQQLGF